MIRIKTNLFSRLAPASIGRRGLFGMALAGIVGALIGCAPDNQPTLQASATRDRQDNKMTGHETIVPLPTPPGKEIATLAGGCFWCTEAIFTELKGVEKVEPGYAGGSVVNPSYEQVCTGTTGHAEAIQILFDPKVISFHDLLSVFFTTHNPTTLNRQGADSGTQYRSSIFYHSEQQKETAQQVIAEVEKQKIWSDKIVTEVVPFTNFYVAENYHHDYFAKHGNAGYCQFVIAPKVAKFREHYRELLKK